ncbi:MAG: DUF1045 domain-containing protein [Steroidobacteraceae bacterium]
MSEATESAAVASGAYRWAVYFSPPPQSPWARAGAGWLGRDVDDGACEPAPRIAGWSAQTWSSVTGAPHRYGWHGTLRAPWRLASGCDSGDVLGVLRTLAAQTAPFDLPPLRLGYLNGFLALQPVHPCAALQALADACVKRLKPTAAPLTPAELERYGARGLSVRQQQYLHAWGYPYVLEEFQFHMTLTERLEALSAAQRAELQAAAAARFDPLPQPLRVDALSLFVQPQPAALLRRVARLPLGGDGATRA